MRLRVILFKQIFEAPYYFFPIGATFRDPDITYADDDYHFKDPNTGQPGAYYDILDKSSPDREMSR